MYTGSLSDLIAVERVSPSKKWGQTVLSVLSQSISNIYKAFHGFRKIGSS